MLTNISDELRDYVLANFKDESLFSLLADGPFFDTEQNRFIGIYYEKTSGNSYIIRFAKDEAPYLCACF